jgi:glycosyltransferase involved in cell wall biosynthesis
VSATDHSPPVAARSGGRGTGSSYAFCARGDARDPAAFSGAPSSVLTALGALGDAPAVVNTELPRRVQRLALNVLALRFTDPHRLLAGIGEPAQLRLAVRSSKPKVAASREMFALLSFVAAARLRAKREVTHAIQFGSEYRLPRGISYVTLDDATIAQLHRSYDYEWMRLVPEQTLSGMISRQRAIFQRAKACCFLNRWAAESAVADYGIRPERVHVVGTGSNREVSPMSRDWSHPRFLFVGMDFSRKNGDRLLQAFARIREEHPDARLDVVGGHPPIVQDGVTGHGVLRLGDSQEKASLDRLFGEATCLVLPSLLEPTGNVHAEALSAGIGSIGTKSGGVDTVIGDAGTTVWPEDVESLVGEMARFCDPQTARDYGDRAQRRAALFTWTAVAERVLRALGPPGVDDAALAEFL